MPTIMTTNPPPPAQIGDQLFDSLLETSHPHNLSPSPSRRPHPIGRPTCGFDHAHTHRVETDATPLSLSLPAHVLLRPAGFDRALWVGDGLRFDKGHMSWAGWDFRAEPEIDMLACRIWSEYRAGGENTDKSSTKTGEREKLRDIFFPAPLN